MLLKLLESLAQVLHDVLLLCKTRPLAALHILTLDPSSYTLMANWVLSVAFHLLTPAPKTLGCRVSERSQLGVAAYINVRQISLSWFNGGECLRKVVTRVFGVRHVVMHMAVSRIARGSSS